MDTKICFELKSQVSHIEPYKAVSQKAWKVCSDREVMKLDWNESPFPIPDRVKHRLVSFIYNNPLNWYPPLDGFGLNRDLLELFAPTLTLDNIELFSGSDATLESLVRAFCPPGSNVILLYPSYDNFRVYVEIERGNVMPYYPSNVFNPGNEIDDFIDFAVNNDPSIVYLINPNNPIGYFLEDSDLVKVIEALPQTLIVVDEAYIEFSSRPAGSWELLERYPNLAICRTFSKALGLAGFRIGYVLANEQIITALRKVKNPQSVSTLSITAAKAAIESLDEISLNIEQIKQTRQYLIKQLNTFSEIRAYTSEGNFVLVNTEEQIIEQIRYEFEINNIYTRALSHIQGMNGFFRITVGTRRSAERIIAILRQVLR